MRRWLISIVFLLTFQVAAQDTIASDILASVNSTRQAAGTAQLVFNAQLQMTAQQHSDDMASVDQLSHTGTDGSQFWERMQVNGYNLTTGAENVLSRGDTNAQQTFNQWFNSVPHRENMLNPDYQEVGIAYARAASGRFYFTMVLGSRADFMSPTAILTQTSLPTNTSLPTLTPIPLTATTIPTLQPTQTLIPTSLPTDTPVPIATATQQVVTPIQIVTNTPLPTATEYILPDIRLIYDEDSFLLVNVSGNVLNLSGLVFESENATLSALRWNTEFLSQPLSGFTNSDCLHAWTFDVSFLTTPDGCHYRHGWIAVGDEAHFWRETDIFTVRNGENLIGICFVDDGSCDVSLSTVIDDLALVDPVQFGQLPDLRLDYPDSSFTLTNISGRRLDLTGIVFRSDSGLLTIESWDNGFLTQPLNNFEAGGCLQAWTPDYANQSLPQRCEMRHAWILVNDAGDFWRQTENFTVERDGVILGQCSLNETRCTMSLRSNLGATVRPTTIAMQPTSTPIPTIADTFTNDVQIVISDESITLINTSNRPLDFSGFAFQGANGIFSATRWNIPELSVPLNAVPSGDCLQLWAVGTLEQSKPDVCNVRHAWVAAFAYEQFWEDSTVFTVFYNSTQILTCEIRVSACNFDLP